MKMIFLAVLVASCASKPQLYPNEKYKSVGEKMAQKDVDVCMAEAEKYLKSSKGKQVAKSSGYGAAVGAAIGAVGGMFGGNMGRGLIRGGAMGAAGGAAAGAVSPNELKQRYVNQCLADKGYKVISWD
jgi:hypothetical protein